jgi:hypothetical protein
MANDQGIRYGAFPIYSPQSPPIVLYYRCETGATLDWFRGQFVQINSRGNAMIIAPTDNISSCGVAWEFLDTNLAGLPSGMTTLTQGAYLPRATDGYVGVIIDPQQLYLMEEITGGTAMSANSIGYLVNFTYTATTGNTVTGYANTVLQNSTISAGTGPLLQLMNVYNITNQDGTTNAPGASCKWVVRIANHQFNGTKVSVPQA